MKVKHPFRCRLQRVHGPPPPFADTRNIPHAETKTPCLHLDFSPSQWFIHTE